MTKPGTVDTHEVRWRAERVEDLMAEMAVHTRALLDRVAGVPAETDEPAAPVEFELRPDHVKLLRHANVTWSPLEWGSPQIDPKRPLGNSSLWQDVAEILGWPQPDDDSYEGYDAARAIYGELLVALQIVLATGSFEPGRYVRDNRYDSRGWRRAEARAGAATP